jgi:cysteinyl-tRNA synthetase
MASLNVRPATTHPQATKEIDGMIEMIQTLIDKNFGYVADDGTVYYRTRMFPGYGKLSHKNIDDLRGGNRELKVTGEEQKEDPLDFVLWKPKKEGEPYWNCPWCKGRPGWHIECSVMSRKYLGETIDIHAGGEDLVFPHHENEIAQSEASSGKPFANYWMHNAFLNIDNRKMSKSLGNFFTVRDILDQYDGQVIRYFMQTVHYRSPLNFSRDLMESAKTSYERIVNCAENLTFLEGKAAGSLTEEEKALIAQADAYRVQFEEAMDDDFNTANALSAIFELVTFINSHADGNASRDLLLAFHKELAALTDICGLTLERKNDLAEDEVAYIEAKIAERKAAKKAKDFARADAIRAELKEKGIILEDTREGVKWKKA